MEKTARDTLLTILKPGDTVFTVLRHVSKSGMLRRIDAYVFRNGEPVYLSGMIEALGVAKRATGYKDGLVMRGCGMDMGFALVYNLGRALWPDGTQKPHGTRNGKPDTDGGYALKHRWL